MRQIYTRRRSRMTAAQERAYARLDEHRFDPEASLKTLSDSSGSPLLVEIGFGNGEALAAFAKNHSDWTCLGVDVYRPGIGSLIQRCETDDLSNVHVAETDALSLLESLSDSCIDLVFVFFPDPWPKRRHHRRRLVNEEFAGLIATKTKMSGEIYIATDWEHYANAIEKVMSSQSLLEGGAIERCELRPKTRYEERGEKLGHEIWEFRFCRKSVALN